MKYLLLLSLNAYSLTYKDVKPIFNDRCNVCHQGIPDKNWMIYEQAFKNKDMIKLRLENKTMPPAGMPLTDAERKKVINWVKEGAKK